MLHYLRLYICTHTLLLISHLVIVYDCLNHYMVCVNHLVTGTHTYMTLSHTLVYVRVNCIYIGTINTHTVQIAVFVDDILIAAENLDVINDVKSLFSKQYRDKDMGLAEEFLNIRITQRPGEIMIDQEPYVRTREVSSFRGDKELS
jgi:hypothetical protein